MNLRLLQISDSALPIGGYTHSWGLEAALACGLAADAASLENWTRGWLKGSIGPLEGVVVGATCRAAREADWPLVMSANELMTASVIPPTLRLASHEMGEQLLSLAATWEWSADQVAALPAPPHRSNFWHHCVVFGVLGAMAGANTLETVQSFLHQAVLGMVAAGVRAIPVGHTHGQQIVAYLHGDIERLAGKLAELPLETAGSGVPFYEVLCDEQTRLYSRMFRS